MKAIQTSAAPEAIGTYSQAVESGPWLFLSGQIPLVPETMLQVDGYIAEQTRQVFKNLSAVCQAAGGQLSDVVKLTVYLTDLGNFQVVNEVMSSFFDAPYPARAAVEVSALPKGVDIEIDGIMFIQR